MTEPAFEKIKSGLAKAAKYLGGGREARTFRARVTTPAEEQSGPQNRELTAPVTKG